ncbi:hypothetical protein CLOM_g4573 [Closterium sp. NIES-68]|nr:hypothetical protein CLOM_g4573 [Closterium sp. NIES-68]GJP82085.1 hypothetical protein CLOP_g12307 [Closterium sp. NIES-67]
MATRPSLPFRATAAVVFVALFLLIAADAQQPTPGQQQPPIRPSTSSPLTSSPPSSIPLSSSSPSSSPPTPFASPFQPPLLGGLQANLTPILLPTSTAPNPTTTTPTPGATGARPSNASNAAGINSASALPGGGASVVTLLLNAANGTVGFALPWAQGAGENVQAGIYTVGDMLNGSSPRLVLPLMGMAVNSTPPAAASATRAASASSSALQPLNPLAAAGSSLLSFPPLDPAAAAATSSSSTRPSDPLAAAAAAVAGAMAGLGGASGAPGGTAGTAGATGAAGAGAAGVDAAGADAAGAGAAGSDAAGAGTAGADAAGAGAAGAGAAGAVAGAPRRGLSGAESNPVAAAVGAAQGALGRGSGWLWGAVPVPGAALVNILRDPSQYQLRLSAGSGSDVSSFAGRLVAVPIDLARSIPFLGSLIPEPPRLPVQPNLVGSANVPWLSDLANALVEAARSNPVTNLLP